MKDTALILLTAPLIAAWDILLGRYPLHRQQVPPPVTQLSNSSCVRL